MSIILMGRVSSFVTVMIIASGNLTTNNAIAIEFKLKTDIYMNNMGDHCNISLSILNIKNHSSKVQN